MATITIAPPTRVSVLGRSSSASHTHTGPSTTSSSVIRPTCAAGMRRAPTVSSANPSPIWPIPSAASQKTSSPPISPALANGRKAAIRISCERHVAGAIDTSWRQRVITIISANASAATNERPSPARLPSPGAPSMIVTPASASAIARTVRRVSGSPSVTRASSAASTGATARMKSTRATLVWFRAAMKAPDAVATHRATATPASPTERNASTTRPRSTTATYASSATPAKAARPDTWVGVSSVSCRCRTPAVDHAIAARAT
jgi:hypothetical protein